MIPQSKDFDPINDSLFRYTSVDRLLPIECIGQISQLASTQIFAPATQISQRH